MKTNRPHLNVLGRRFGRRFSNRVLISTAHARRFRHSQFCNWQGKRLCLGAIVRNCLKQGQTAVPLYDTVRRPGAGGKSLRAARGIGYGNSMDSKEALVALNMIEHVGPVRVRQLLEHFGEAPAILAASRQQLRQVRGIGEETAEAIAGWEKTVDLGGELKRIGEFGCHVLTQSDEEYPELLRQIYDPPIVLYVKGRLTAKDKNAVAMVGSRMTTHYGQEVARKLAYQLAYIGVTVVSGGARGIDTAAHQGALSAKGRTVVVLGTGINVVFPPENRELFERVAASGAVITQFPFNRKADKQ